ncbi:MAG: macrolide ABC transporter ATP-binding protein [Phycisphaerae bacterium]|nr:macrolide ABC transporter ATP-binding protein [Phycisphaerae bacterium]
MSEESPTAPDDAAVISLAGITRTYFKPDGSILVEALKNIDLDISRGEYVAIMGASGSGKSTMMNIIGALDQPTSGSCFINGSDIASMSDEELSTVRGRSIGFVFQAFNLIGALTVIENVEVPLFYQAIPRLERQKRTIEILQRVGLGDRLGHRPNELSGGQQQRVAIARALVTNPAVLLADEPTGNLDSSTGEDILALLDELHREGLTIVMVTHDESIAERCDRVIRLRDGVIELDERTSKGEAAMSR